MKIRVQIGACVVGSFKSMKHFDRPSNLESDCAVEGLSAQLLGPGASEREDLLRDWPACTNRSFQRSDQAFLPRPLVVSASPGAAVLEDASSFALPWALTVLR
jgi:hypothetical protein